MSKYVIWMNDAIGKVQSVEKVDEDIEYNHCVLKRKLSIFKFIWYWITEKRFRWHITSSIQYAIIHHNIYRGNLSTDVALGELCKGFKNIWRKNNK